VTVIPDDRMPSAVPALSLALIDGYEIVSVEAYGVLESGADAGATPKTLFQAGSISKPVAALVALRLVESGALDLDRDVNELLVEWKVPGETRVTLRQLLSHTAGLGVHFFPGYSREGPVPSLPEVLEGEPPANTLPVRVEEQPGEFRYSGGGYAVVQQLVADVAGASFSELAAELVFEPLGMADSTFEQPLPQALQPGAAHGHQGGKAVDGGWHVYPEAAAAGLWTTPSDLARFALGLQRALAGDSDPITSGTARLMVSPQVDLPAEGELSELRELGIEPPDQFGLGVFVSSSRWFSHLGDTAGFFAALNASIAGGMGLVVMTNADPHPFLVELWLELADEHGWEGVRAE
jgi:CubicO group peptidase (beta-lactamase class C family)